jgi:hypothetical protein
MLVALLAGFLIFSGGNGFAAKMFGKDNQAQVRQVVSDPARAEAAVRILKQGEKDLEAIGKQLEKIAKGFSKTDEDKSAGLDRLTPFMQQASAQRRVEQGKTLDRLFELRKTLTQEEWSALLEKLK